MTFYAVLIEHPSSGPSQSPFHPFCHLSALRGRDPTPSPLSPWFWGWTKPVYNRVLPSALCVIFSLSSTSLSPSFLICEEGPKNVFLTAVLRGGHRYSEAPGSVRSLLSSLLRPPFIPAPGKFHAAWTCWLRNGGVAVMQMFHRWHEAPGGRDLP